MKVTQLPRLWRTVRHLRATQIVGQARVRARGFFCYGPGKMLDGLPHWPGVRWQPRGDWLAPGTQDNTAPQIRSGQLAFVGQTHDIGWPPRWDDDTLPSRLWRYNLHYLEYLWALPCEDARTLVRHWIEHHPLSRAHAGWEPYPTSLRLMNLCCVLFGRFHAQTEADEAFRDALWQSIHRQAEWLHANLETHIQANHLLENAAALALVGACFDGADAERWRQAGLAMLRRELAEQVLGDGGHYERSPMYHVRIAYVLALLVNTNDVELTAVCTPVLARMIDALAKLCHPDGEIALLNDSALGIYNPPTQLIDYVRTLLDQPTLGKPAAGAFALTDTGYYGSRNARGDFVLCDAAPIGPDHQPGHAHGDLFSFEMSCRGRRLIVDAGNDDYEPSDMRAYCRSTRAHNTVEIDGQDQCEFWGAFRVGRRARPHDVRWRVDGQGFCLDGWHDGYQWLPGRPTHRRAFTWYEQGTLIVRDTITSAMPVTAISRLRLHPDWRIQDMDSRRAVVTCDGLWAVLLFADGAAAQRDPQPHWYCSRFGQREPCEVIMLKGSGTRVQLSFAVCTDTNAAERVEGLLMDG